MPLRAGVISAGRPGTGAAELRRIAQFAFFQIENRGPQLNGLRNNVDAALNTFLSNCLRTKHQTV